MFPSGYGIDGQKIARSLDVSEVSKLLEDADNPDRWKDLTDLKNQTTYTLTPSDLEVIS